MKGKKLIALAIAALIVVLTACDQSNKPIVGNLPLHVNGQDSAPLNPALLPGESVINIDRQSALKLMVAAQQEAESQNLTLFQHTTSAWTLLSQKALVEAGEPGLAANCNCLSSFEILRKSGADSVVFTRNFAVMAKRHDQLWGAVSVPGHEGSTWSVIEHQMDLLDNRGFDPQKAEWRIGDLEQKISVGDNGAISRYQEELSYTQRRLDIFRKVTSLPKGATYAKSMELPVALEWEVSPTAVQRAYIAEHGLLKAGQLPFAGLRRVYVPENADGDVLQALKEELSKIAPNAEISVLQGYRPSALQRVVQGVEAFTEYLPAIALVTIALTPAGVEIADWNEATAGYNDAFASGRTNMTEQEWGVTHSNMLARITNPDDPLAAPIYQAANALADPALKESPWDSYWLQNGQPQTVDLKLIPAMPIMLTDGGKTRDVNNVPDFPRLVASTQKVGKLSFTYKADGGETPLLSVVNENGGTESWRLSAKGNYYPKCINMPSAHGNVLIQFQVRYENYYRDTSAAGLHIFVAPVGFVGCPNQ